MGNQTQLLLRCFPHHGKNCQFSTRQSQIYHPTVYRTAHGLPRHRDIIHGRLTRLGHLWPQYSLAICQTYKTYKSRCRHSSRVKLVVIQYLLRWMWESISKVYHSSPVSPCCPITLHRQHRHIIRPSTTAPSTTCGNSTNTDWS
jgi:hypothetical protein